VRCESFIDAAPKLVSHPAVVNGFTGSGIWHSIYAFPPTDQKYWQKGFDDFANAGCRSWMFLKMKM